MDGWNKLVCLRLAKDCWEQKEHLPLSFCIYQPPCDFSLHNQSILVLGQCRLIHLSGQDGNTRDDHVPVHGSTANCMGSFCLKRHSVTRVHGSLKPGNVLLINFQWSFAHMLHYALSSVTFYTSTVSVQSSERLFNFKFILLHYITYCCQIKCRL